MLSENNLMNDLPRLLTQHLPHCGRAPANAANRLIFNAHFCEKVFYFVPLLLFCQTCGQHWEQEVV